LTAGASFALVVSQACVPKLSILISRFNASLDAYDLKFSLLSAGCSGVAVAPEEFIVQLDGVPGTPSSLRYANEAVFTWALFPEAPTVLPLVRGYDA